ncbi:CBASS cGAMP-activated phospholipase [Mesorhizobium sp. YIM 152430]|uniref:CBASS cGAMP-activated phospholipase n=1 Tax=Mesorhizobium sp. YIM 152430 TaxID=3031761 RepID=UPI0023DB7898|nr:CBASS cGAMP-activated phospholipase [Mesorhizobium sp. YIM 152430]MDF1600927.1 CBASS cGAMP-activated phospholipase [Mesorhizobium sp. YIM 152430]
MPFQILSLSGGGYLGLYTAAVLAEIEALYQKPIIDSFDMIVGTSVGGITALGLSAGTPASEILDSFYVDGPDIFGSSRPPRGGISGFLNVVRGIRKARYDPNPLRGVIERIVGAETVMANLRRPTLVPAVNLTKGGPRVFKTGHHPDFKFDWRLNVVDVALATSAAPTYFPLHRIGSELFADGGMFANSPDMIGIHEAEHFLDIDREDIHLLSIGTTTTKFAFSSSVSQQIGAYGWMKDERLPTVMIGCQQALADHMVQHILKERYLRIDREQSPDQKVELALDCASENAKRDLSAMAAQSAMEMSNDRRLEDMLSHSAPPFSFINAGG